MRAVCLLSCFARRAGMRIAENGGVAGGSKNGDSFREDVRLAVFANSDMNCRRILDGDGNALCDCSVGLGHGFFFRDGLGASASSLVGCDVRCLGGQTFGMHRAIHLGFVLGVYFQDVWRLGLSAAALAAHCSRDESG